MQRYLLYDKTKLPCGLFVYDRINGSLFLVSSFSLKSQNTVNQCEQCIIRLAVTCPSLVRMRFIMA